MNVRLTPAAQDDIARVYRWYEARREGFGLRFISAVDQAIVKIAESPLGHQTIIKNARKLELVKFPCALWYTVEPDEGIVIGCLHGHRDRTLARHRALGVIPFPEP